MTPGRFCRFVWWLVPLFVLLLVQCGTEKPLTQSGFLPGDAVGIAKDYLAQKKTETSDCLQFHESVSTGDWTESRQSNGRWVVTHKTRYGTYKWEVYEGSRAVGPIETPSSPYSGC